MLEAEATGTTLVVIGAADELTTTGVTLLLTTTTGFEEVTGIAGVAELRDTLVTGAALETGLVKVHGQLVMVKRVAWEASHVSISVQKTAQSCTTRFSNLPR